VFLIIITITLICLVILGFFTYNYFIAACCLYEDIKTATQVPVTTNMQLQEQPDVSKEITSCDKLFKYAIRLFIAFLIALVVNVFTIFYFIFM